MRVVADFGLPHFLTERQRFIHSFMNLLPLQYLGQARVQDFAQGGGRDFAREALAIFFAPP